MNTKGKNHFFKQLFFKKENKELLGENYRNFSIIVIILTVTFLAIGFANGSLEYLGKKMKDPFVNWVNVKVPNSKINTILSIRKKLNETKIKNKYNISNVTGYDKGSLFFYDNKTKGSYRRFYRTVALNDPILSYIVNKKNLVSGRGFDTTKNENYSEIGLIVKEDLLKELHYPLNASHLLMSFKETDSTYRNIPVPIIGVVKDLPGLSDFITTPYFYRIRNFSYRGNIFNPLEDRRLVLFSNDDSANVYRFADSVITYLQEKYNITAMSTIQPDSSSYIPGYNVMLDFWPEVKNINTIDLYYNKLKESGIYNILSNHIRLYDYQSRQYKLNDIGRYENISVNFSNLDKVRDFADFLLSKYEIQIDTAQVNAKENYNFITKLTRIISLILIGFSILSVCLFVSNLLKSHLESIKMNLGTLKAFGLSNKLLENIYIKLVIRFMSLSIFISLVISWLLGYFGLLRMLLMVFGDNLEKGENYFKLFDTWTLITVVLILLISIMVIINTARKILKRTPGDLIYNR